MGGVIKQVPDKPDAAASDVFYRHGSAEEIDGAGEKYHMAVDAVASSSAVVITVVSGDTDPQAYTRKVKQQVESLTSNGVQPGNITISGFSGGRYCADGGLPEYNRLKLNTYGLRVARIFSIRFSQSDFPNQIFSAINIISVQKML